MRPSASRAHCTMRWRSSAGAAADGKHGAVPPDQRTALLLVTVDGLSYKETAEIVGVPVGTIMSRLARARIALQLQLEVGGGMRRSTDNAEAQ